MRLIPTRSERRGSGLATLLCVVILVPPLSEALAQEGAPHDIGVVYYKDGTEFKALAKEADSEGGHINYSGKVKGAHAFVRLPAGGTYEFRVCNVDPSRYKLYTLKSSGNSRSVTIAKANVWIGGSKSVISESEVPTNIQVTDGACFAITPKEPLKNGEYGFSPVGAHEVFAFGVGDVKQNR
jgi:hypothetical protein